MHRIFVTKMQVYRGIHRVSFDLAKKVYASKSLNSFNYMQEENLVLPYFYATHFVTGPTFCTCCLTIIIATTAK